MQNSFLSCLHDCRRCRQLCLYYFGRLPWRRRRQSTTFLWWVRWLEKFFLFLPTFPILYPVQIASDDMRPEMTPYGHDYMHTPNFQVLADDGFVFRRAYVQQASLDRFSDWLLLTDYVCIKQALCAPSRTVLLTGRRPDTSRVVTIVNA